MTRIAFITDLHLADDLQPTRGVDTREHFIRVLKDIDSSNYDHIILGGDLCLSDAHIHTYKFIKSSLDALNTPYDVISGNHDKGNAIAAVFYEGKNVTNNELFFARQIGGFPFLFLDTTTSSLTNEQWHFTETELVKHKKEELFIVMHHPPIWNASAYMETKNYHFKEIDRFQRLLSKCTNPVYIFTGHYHIEKTIVRDNIYVFITPSLYIQIDDLSEELLITDKNPSYREIIIDGSEMQTRVKTIYE